MKSIILALIITLSGCQVVDFIKDNPETSDLVIQYATLKYIEGGDDTAKRAARVVERLESFSSEVDGNISLSIAGLEQEFKDSINFNEMQPSDRVLVGALILSVKNELDRRIAQGAIDEDFTVTVKALIDSVLAAARTYAV